MPTMPPSMQRFPMVVLPEMPMQAAITVRAPMPQVVPDLHEIVDLDAVLDHGVLDCAAVDRGIAPHLDVVADQNRADLRHLDVPVGIARVTETIPADDAARLQYAARPIRTPLHRVTRATRSLSSPISTSSRTTDPGPTLTRLPTRAPPATNAPAPIQALGSTSAPASTQALAWRPPLTGGAG